MKLNGPLSFHARFDAAIKGLEGLCQKKLKGSKVSPTSRKSCECILSLCKKYNNSIYSLQGHNKRVVARAYRSYKKNQTSGSLDDSKVNFLRQRVNKGTINNTDFDQKALNLDFVKTLKGKDLKAFTALLKNDADIITEFVTKNKEKLLSSDNKEIFNALPVEAQKAFIEQNKHDIAFLSTFSNIYKEELLKDQSLCIKTVLTFKDIIKKDERLLAQLNKDINIISNKTINKLKSENLQDQQAFIDMFKDNDDFVAGFLEIWKEDLMKNPSCVSFLPEAIKNFISCYGSDNSFFNENNVKTFINNNKTDDISMNCLFVLFNDEFQQNSTLLQDVVTIMANPDSNTLESLLKKQDKPSLLPDQQKEIHNYLKGNNNTENIKNIQILRDIDRGYAIDFVGPNGGRVEFRNIDGQDKTKVLENVKSQAKNLSEEDIKALIDFMNYCPAQGLISAHPSGMTAFQVPFFGDGKPHINVNYDKSGGIELKMQFNGECQVPPLSLCNKTILFNTINTTDNEIVFSYEKSLKEKISNVKVTKFSQDATKIKEIF